VPRKAYSTGSTNKATVNGTCPVSPEDTTSASLPASSRHKTATAYPVARRDEPPAVLPPANGIMPTTIVPRRVPGNQPGAKTCRMHIPPGASVTPAERENEVKVVPGALAGRARRARDFQRDRSG
jgi:hypothetical protein